MRTIETKFVGPTNTKGARIKAISDGVSVTVSYDYALSNEDRHALAAIALCRKMGWSGRIVGHHSPKGNGFYFHFAIDTGYRYSIESGERVES